MRTRGGFKVFPRNEQYFPLWLCRATQSIQEGYEFISGSSVSTYVWIYVCGNAIGPRGEANPSSASLGTTFTSIIIIYTNPTARQTGRADRYAHATCTDGPIPLRLRDSGGWRPFRQIRELRCDWLKLATRDTDWILKRNWKAQWFDIDFPPPSTHFNGLLW